MGDVADDNKQIWVDAFKVARQFADSRAKRVRERFRRRFGVEPPEMPSIDALLTEEEL